MCKDGNTISSDFLALSYCHRKICRIRMSTQYLDPSVYRYRMCTVCILRVRFAFAWKAGSGAVHSKLRSRNTENTVQLARLWLRIDLSPDPDPAI
jgi:hypothetical protein